MLAQGIRVQEERESPGMRAGGDKFQPSIEIMCGRRLDFRESLRRLRRRVLLALSHAACRIEYHHYAVRRCCQKVLIFCP